MNEERNNQDNRAKVVPHPIDAELDYLAKVIARCRSSWPKDPRVNTLATQLASWNKGGNRTELRRMITRLIDDIRSGSQ